MALAKTIAADLQREGATTRKLLERVPEGLLDWRPHARSMSFRELTSHMANLLGWTEPTLRLDEFELPEEYKPWKAGSGKELLVAFDEGLQKAVVALDGSSDEELMKPWSLKSGGKTHFTLPRVGVIQGFVLKHLVHHRGQLSVYLRLNDLPVPAIYGPSADES